MTSASQISKTGISYIDSLLCGRRWDGSVLAYSFPTQASYYGASYTGTSSETQYWAGGFSATEQSAVREIFRSISTFTNLSFVEVQETATTHADLRFGHSNSPNASASAWAYYPGNLSSSGDVWLWASYSDYSPGSSGNQTLMHEIGHVLGLKHPFISYNGFPAATSDAERYYPFTVMDYFGVGNLPGTGTPNFSPEVYSRGDIAALQEMYGANFDTHSGNTDYIVTPGGEFWYMERTPEGTLTSGTLKVASDPVFYTTLWDGGGGDGYNFNQLAQDQWVDLRPGKGSVILHDQQLQQNSTTMIANIYNAFQYHEDPRSLIETVLCGSGNDVIVGNSASNLIVGGGGYDVCVIDSVFSANKIKFGVPASSGYFSSELNGSEFSYAGQGINTYHALVAISGPEGSDEIKEVEEILFRDKRLFVECTETYFNVRVEDYSLSNEFKGDWWAHTVKTTDELMYYLV
ncbi:MULTISPECIES: M10 family metallopeptidase [Pseudomonas]|uniref:Peptidase metallopeptidase domain-containing protein n=2 Tax=Pseudomonas nitroreducens TaxID=46680 RepID=A0A6G6IZV7_PSENT|nr:MULTISPECIES: M10 family metallopeptidase [Pseudomonas]QIE88675.1 hypothetical protein G5B91_21330 [Pseudomonas nitroreducens]UCL85163.1 M10 family metallopeptidase [Pseudomonas sp. HS-18]